jgi:ketosteroid isomerase-like protein
MKNIAYFTLFAFLFLSCNKEIKKEIKIISDPVLVATWNLNNLENNSILTAETENEQIWLDYIAAHNKRDLNKIAAMNAEDWEAYIFDGRVVKGNEAHQVLLKEWFKSSSPKWKTKWMIANAGVDEKSEMNQWLITGDDMKQKGSEGNINFLHLVHQVQIVDGKIKKIYAYSREPEAKESKLNKL